MKYAYISLFVILFTCAACEEPEIGIQSAGGYSFDESWSIWAQERDLHGNSYSFTLARKVDWLGYGFLTTMKVENGAIVERHFEEYRVNWAADEWTIVESYTETGSNVGADERGERPTTIDRIYERCRDHYLRVDQKENQLVFETDAKGILASCGYYNRNVKDAGLQGYLIENLQWD